MVNSKDKFFLWTLICVDSTTKVDYVEGSCSKVPKLMNKIETFVEVYMPDATTCLCLNQMFHPDLLVKVYFLDTWTGIMQDHLRHETPKCDM